MIIFKNYEKTKIRRIIEKFWNNQKKLLWLKMWWNISDILTMLSSDKILK